MWSWVGTTRNIELSAQFDNDVLACPDCGEDYLHQYDVIVDKDKDVAILFWCEHCGQRTAPKKLWIRQHKGNTLLEWEQPIFEVPRTYPTKDRW